MTNRERCRINPDLLMLGTCLDTAEMGSDKILLCRDVGDICPHPFSQLEVTWFKQLSIFCFFTYSFFCFLENRLIINFIIINLMEKAYAHQ